MLPPRSPKVRHLVLRDNCASATIGSRCGCQGRAVSEIYRSGGASAYQRHACGECQRCRPACPATVQKQIPSSVCDPGRLPKCTLHCFRRGVSHFYGVYFLVLLLILTLCRTTGAGCRSRFGDPSPRAGLRRLETTTRLAPSTSTSTSTSSGGGGGGGGGPSCRHALAVLVLILRASIFT